MNCSPQRFLPNSRNLFRAAALTPTSVLPVENQVQRIPYRRKGTAQGLLSGTYAGFERADYDVEIIDTTVEVARVSAPTHSGAGSATLGSISASGASQIFTLENVIASILGAAASAQVEGATIEWAIEGTPGNLGRITVDQSGLVFTDTNYSLVSDVQAGQGSSGSPLIGQAFDFDAALLDGQGKIPTTAHRFAFENDHSNIYLQYKQFVDGESRYFTVPSLKRDYPKGTRIQFVTGGRTVAVTDGTSTETTTGALPSGVVTAFDFLNWIRTVSTLLKVVGVVPDDRSPTGLSSREFSLRTDAHAEASTGTGSSYAKGFTNISVASDAGTQSVTATCFAVTSADHPNANLGHTLWELKSSLLGDLGVIAEGVPFLGTAFGLTIPVALPPGFGSPKGRISATYAPISRTLPDVAPPVCFVDMFLGPNAIDGTYTFELVAPPTGDCDCRGMPVPPVSQFCLGTPTEGGDVSTYQPDTVTRLIAMRLWETETVRALSTLSTATGAPSKEAAGISNPVDGPAQPVAQTVYYAQATASLKTVINNFEIAAAQLDVLEDGSPTAYRTDGFAAWDAALTELQSDIADALSSPPSSADLINIPSDRYDARLTFVLISAGIPGVGKSDASTVSGDGCWRDLGTPLFWKCVGSDLMPMFTNTLYYASRPNGSGRVFSSHEFSILANVKCDDDLKVGDQILVNISNASRGSTYQVGDVEELPIVSASPLTLSGGVNAAPIQTWTVTGSISGPFPACTFNPDSPLAYTETVGGSTVAFLLAEGGIPTAQGDRFRFAVEGGHYRWRVNGGAWSADSPPLPIPLGSDAIEHGLSLSFVAGAAASFAQGDLYKFRALQPWAVSNTQLPSEDVWKWDGDGAEYAADFGSPQQIDLFAMLHGLPPGATVVLWGGLAAANEWSEAITYRTDATWKAMDHAPRYVRIVITDAAGGWIQWPWAGVPLSTALSSEFIPSVDYLVNRPSGNLQGGRYIGRGIGGDVVWTENALSDTDVGWSTEDVDGLRSMFDVLKFNDDEPFLFIPQITRIADPVVFARLGSDSLRFEDQSMLNRNEGGARRWAVTMPLAPVYR